MPQPHRLEPSPPRPTRLYTPPCLERLGGWQFSTGATCEPGVVCFDNANPLERLFRPGPGGHR